MKKKSKPTWPPGAWIPRRMLGRYCSQACGAGCTFAAFQLATTRAATLVGRLGPGWKARVWENLGWHYSAVHRSGMAFVYPSGRGRWCAFADPSSPGSGGGRWSAYAKTPRVAVKAVLEQLRAEAKMLESIREQVRR